MKFDDLHSIVSSNKGKTITKSTCIAKLEEILKDYLLENNIDLTVSEKIVSGLRKDFIARYEKVHCYTLSTTLENSYLRRALKENGIDCKKMSHLSIIVKENFYILVSHSSYKYPVLISY